MVLGESVWKQSLHTSQLWGPATWVSNYSRCTTRGWYPCSLLQSRAVRTSLCLSVPYATFLCKRRRIRWKREPSPLFYPTNLLLYLWHKLEISLWNSVLFIGLLPPCMPILREGKYLLCMDRSWEQQNFTLLWSFSISTFLLPSLQAGKQRALPPLNFCSSQGKLNQHQIFLTKEPRSNP